METRYRRVPDWVYFFGTLPFLALLPRKWGYSLARRQGRHICAQQDSHRETMVRNLGVFLQGEAAIRGSAGELACQAFESLALDDFEAFYYPFWRSRNIDDYFDFEGLENLDRLIERGQRVLLFTAHFGSPCSAVVALALKGYPLHHLVNDSPANPAFPTAFRSYARMKIDWMQKKMGRKFILFEVNSGSITSKSAAMNAYRLLTEKKLVSMAIDVPPGQVDNKGLVRFLGKSCYFPTGLIQLAHLTGAAVVPYFAVRDKAKRCGQAIVVESPVEMRGDLTADLQACVDRLDRMIRAKPGDWLVWDSWSHFWASANGC